MNSSNRNTTQEIFLSAQNALQQNDLINALARFTQVLAIDDNHTEARLSRAEVLLQLGDVKGAAEDGQWLLEHNHKRESLQVINKVLELNPQFLQSVSGDFTADGTEHRAPAKRLLIKS